MTAVMAQPGLGLAAPTSRQDIISALLNDYEKGWATSPYGFSPGLDSKELPPPPPGGDEKALPGMMKFQLRVDEQPRSPFSVKGGRSGSTEPPKRILSQSISRNSKPRSLNLVVSNGSTATVPPSPVPPAPRKDDPAEDRPLPPPPPVKSRRRQRSMGSEASRLAKERRDSKDPEDSNQGPPPPPKKEPNESSQTLPVERKPVPILQKFKSLADLGKGPRGKQTASTRNTGNDDGSNASIRTASTENDSTKPSIVRPSEERTSRSAMSGERPTFSNAEAPAQTPPTEERIPRKVLPSQRSAVNKAEVPTKTPPTPDQQPVAVRLPVPPRKALVGLPSNPRGKSQDAPLQQNKSPAGFGMMKAPSSSNELSFTPTTKLETITPGPTPSPRKTEAVQAESKTEGPSLARQIRTALESPVSPSPESFRRRFSFEDSPEPRQELGSVPPPPAKEDVSPVSPPAAAIQFPPRTTSRTATPPPASTASSASTTPRPTVKNPAQRPPPTQTQQPISFPTSWPPRPDPNNPESAVVVPPVPTTPLPLTAAHYNCYTNHKSLTSYTDRVQPRACMACKQNPTGLKWVCSWCYLRICPQCANTMSRIPGRNLEKLLEVREEQERNVLREVDEEDEEEKKEVTGKGKEGAMPSVVVTKVQEMDFT